MREIYLEILTTTKDEKRVSYDTIYQRTGISVSKLQRIFTGQSTLSTDDFELICEKGLELDLDEVYAKFGKQEFRDSEEVDYKGTKELLADFAKKEEAIKADFEARIEREREIVRYLKTLVDELKQYNAKLTERAISAELRADAAEDYSKKLDKRRHDVFWGMFGLSMLLLVLLVLGIVLDLPFLGMANG